MRRYLVVVLVLASCDDKPSLATTVAGFLDEA